MRQVVLDTETTGLEPEKGHRIIEVGCVELINRRMTGASFHHYVHPQREIDEAAVEVHGITLEFLDGKPVFDEIAEELLQFLKGAELIIHNAPFDVAFLNHEFVRAGVGSDAIDTHCEVLDTLVMARHKHPGQKNSLDALCKRYAVDNTQRQLHGALLDAEILADVYLAMTGGQISLLGESEDLTQSAGSLNSDNSGHGNGGSDHQRDGTRKPGQPTPIVRANDSELALHAKWIELLEKESPGKVVWHEIDSAS